MNNRVANKQDYLKLAAIIFMLIDHIGLYFYPHISLARALGRIVFPIFCFYAGYNFKKSVNFNILLHGLFLFIFTSIFIHHEFSSANILISIFCGHLYLYIFRISFKKPYYYLHYPLLIWGFIFSYKYFQYGSLAILIMTIGYMYKKRIINGSSAALQTCVIAFIHSALSFGREFILTDYAVMLVLFSLLFMIISNERQYMSSNLSFITLISRNSLWIYTIHLVIFQIIWRYC